MLHCTTGMLPHIAAEESQVYMSILALWYPAGLFEAQRLAWSTGQGLFVADIATQQQPEGSGMSRWCIVSVYVLYVVNHLLLCDKVPLRV